MSEALLFLLVFLAACRLSDIELQEGWCVGWCQQGIALALPSHPWQRCISIHSSCSIVFLANLFTAVVDSKPGSKTGVSESDSSLCQDSKRQVMVRESGFSAESSLGGLWWAGGPAGAINTGVIFVVINPKVLTSPLSHRGSRGFHFWNRAQSIWHAKMDEQLAQPPDFLGGRLFTAQTGFLQPFCCSLHVF